MWDLSDWPESLDPDARNRRGVYVFVKRQFPFPMFTTFDAPDSSVSCGRRDVTTVAPQALTMLNSDFMIEKARSFAGRLITEHGQDPGAWVDSAWRTAFARPASPEERQTALEMLQGAASSQSTEEVPGRLVRFALMVFNMNEFLYVD